MPVLFQLLQALDTAYPLPRAESWDRVGLQIGDRRARIGSVYVAHEITAEVLEDSKGHDALAVYHPLLFRALESLDFATHTVRFAADIVKAGQHLICIHTALDNAPPPGALGDHLASQLGLENVTVINASGAIKFSKINVFVPPEALDTVSQAMWEAGAGQIGRYDQASYRTRGTGTFRPLEGAQPYVGEVGARTEVEEWRLEVIAPETVERAVVQAMLAAHPYQEVAYDVYALKNTVGNFGSARMGEIEPQSLTDYAAFVAKALRAPNVRIVRAKEEIRKVACVPGAGASDINAAIRAGADCLVTGDLKHHDALKARAMGISLIDATHVATERATITLIAQVLENVEGLKVTRSQLDTNPFE